MGAPLCGPASPWQESPPMWAALSERVALSEQRLSQQPEAPQWPSDRQSRSRPDLQQAPSTFYAAGADVQELSDGGRAGLRANACSH